MDLILTILLIYLAYRGYNWYTRLQDQVKAGPPPDQKIRGEEEVIDITYEEDDDYIDFEDVK